MDEKSKREKIIKIHEDRDALVVKSNILLKDVRYNLSATEQKIIIYLISKVLADDKDFKRVRLTINDYCAVAGIERGGNSYKKIKDSIEKLSDNSWWIKYEKGERLFRWIDTADLEQQGYVDIVLSESLRPYLLELRQNFTKYELINVLVLHSKHSIRLYELFKANLWLHTWKVSIDDFKDILGISDKYSEYKALRRKVIDPSVNEISKYTDIAVTYEPIKTGRFVTDLIFSIQEKEGYQLTWETILNQRERLGE